MFWVAVIFIVSFCSLFYEVALAQTLSIIFGDTVTQYSITIGLYLFFLGMGSFLSERHKKSKTTLAWVEILLAFLSITGVLVLLYYQGDITRLKLVDMHISRGWYYFVSVIVYLPVAIIGLLSGMEIPLLERASKLKIANVLGVDYIGSLVAAVSFPLLLLPYLGLLKSVLLASSLNAIVAAILIWKRRTLALCVGVLIVFVFLGGLWANTDSIQQSLDMAFVTSTVHSNQSTKWTITHSMNTPYQKIIIGEQSWSTAEGEHVNHFMTLDGEVQYDTRFERQYHEAFVHPLLCRIRNISRVLVVGGGDGMLIRELIKYDTVQRIDHIDIDKKLVGLFKTDPILLQLNDRALLDPRVNTMYADGLAYLRTSATKYDVVFFDLPSPVQEKVARFHTKEVSHLVFQNLKPRGFFITHTSPNHAKHQAPSLRAGGFRHVVNYRQGFVEYLIATSYTLQRSDVSPISLCAGMTQAFLPSTMYNTFANNTIQLEEGVAYSIYQPNPTLIRSGYGMYIEKPKLVDNPLMA